MITEDNFINSTIHHTGKFARELARPVLKFIFNPEQAPLYYQPAIQAGGKSRKRGWWRRAIAIGVIVVILAIGDWLGLGPVTHLSGLPNVAVTTTDTGAAASAALPITALSPAESYALSLNHQ